MPECCPHHLPSLCTIHEMRVLLMSGPFAKGLEAVANSWLMRSDAAPKRTPVHEQLVACFVRIMKLRVRGAVAIVCPACNACVELWGACAGPVRATSGKLWSPRTVVFSLPTSCQATPICSQHRTGQASAMPGAQSASANKSLSLHQQQRQWQRPALVSRQPCSLCHGPATPTVRSVSCQALVAQGPEDDSDADRPADSFSAGAFTRELEARGVVQKQSREAQEAADFDGQQLLDVLLAK